MSILCQWRFAACSALIIAALALAEPSRATCVPKNFATPPPQDPVARILAREARCPSDAREFGEATKRAGARTEPTMVNFVGFHDPDQGAFFIFEIVASDGDKPPVAIERGDLLFGHFTTTDGEKLVANRESLVLELIAWDPDKGFYNFYELTGGEWIYRGDSKDILDDIRMLHLKRKASEPPFGAKLRCSGCHVNGGLLQKELTSPHNDWFVKSRKLPMGTLKPDAFVQDKLAAMADAGELAKVVTAANRRLAASPGYRKVLASRSMQERLRPLFCPVEINIESDADPFDDRKPTLHIPAGFFVDPRLATADITIARKNYDAALQLLGSRLPAKALRVDADHGWLAPVKAQSDILAVDALIDQTIVDKEFVADVLAVDFTNPAFSGVRCGLLTLVPNEGAANLMPRFIDALRGASVPGATELLGNLTDPARNAASHEQRAASFLASCQRRASDPAAVLEWSRLLAQRRAEVSASEISQNPKGHILEDERENSGRIVFPSVQPKAVVGRLALTPICQVK